MEQSPLAIHHVGVAVPSIDDAMQFYGEKLGLSLLETIELPDRQLRVGFVQTSNMLIELLEPTDPDTTVARFIETSSGQIHFRADAQAKGGQVAAGDKWEGVTCAESGDRRHHPEESFWMMKLEDSTGATVRGSSRQSSGPTAAACDPIFGPVPSVVFG